MNGKVLVIVRSFDEVELARAFVIALGDTRCVLLFGQEGLRSRFGETEHPSSAEVSTLFVQNPTDIRLAVCFSGARDLGPQSNLFLLAYLNEIGIATLEIQRDLLQDCVNAANESTAQHFLSWSGTGGIGNLRAVLPRPQGAFVREDVVLVSSRLDSDAYSEEDRFRFTFAVLRLARENPSVCFVWRPSASELQHADAAPHLAMLDKLAPDNLFVEENESFDALLARSSAVVSMASDTLFDCADANKPALVFLGGRKDELPNMRANTFRAYAELARHWGELRAQPARYTLQSELPAVDVERLREQLEKLASSSTPSADWLAVALRYFGYWQESRVRADVGRLQGNVASLEKRVVTMTERIDSFASVGDKSLAGKLDKLLDRVGVLHRSTIAYKATRLLTRVRGGRLKR